MDPLREIEALVAFEERSPGSDSERRAALHLRARLEELGREAKVEAFSTWPNWALTHALHALLAVAGGLVAVAEPTIGTAIVLVALVSAFGDISGSFLLLRRLTGRRASQNVWSPGSGEKPGVLVLVAHYDAGRGGSVYDLRKRFARVPLGLRSAVGPLAALFWAIALVAACSGARVAGLDAQALTVVQFIPTVALVAAVPLLLDIELSDTVPGANDNAAGVAAALDLSQRLGDKLEHFDIHVLLTGAQEAGAQGMRAWLRRHRRELDREATVFLNLEELGSGNVRFTRTDGALLGRRSHRQLFELCEQIAEDDEGLTAQAIKTRANSDAQPARARRYPAISVRCAGPLGYASEHHLETDTPERLDEQSLERAGDFCAELAVRLDAEIGTQLEADGKTPAAPPT